MNARLPLAVLLMLSLVAAFAFAGCTIKGKYRDDDEDDENGGCVEVGDEDCARAASPGFAEPPLHLAP